MKKRPDYFKGNTRDVEGDIITHPSMRKFKRRKLGYSTKGKKGAVNQVIPRRKKK